MAGDVSAASSPAPPSKFASDNDELEWYRTNYHSVVEELHEMMETSKDLEQSLEQELEQSDKEKARLQGKVEGLGFEVDEWRVRINSFGASRREECYVILWA
jgi:chromosome segregation ATPase